MNKPPQMLQDERSGSSGTSHHPDGDRSQNATTLREIPEYFIGIGEVRGFEFTKLYSSASGYLYQVKQPSGLIHYEVIQRIEYLRFGIVAYPKSKSFGKTAWSCRTLADAMVRFNSLA